MNPDNERYSIGSLWVEPEWRSGKDGESLYRYCFIIILERVSARALRVLEDDNVRLLDINDLDDFYKRIDFIHHEEVNVA